MTAVVEVDVAVDVDSIVDLDIDHRSQVFDEDSETTRRSTYKGKDGVDVPRRRSGQRLGDNVKVDVNVLARTFPAFIDTSASCLIARAPLRTDRPAAPRFTPSAVRLAPIACAACSRQHRAG